MDASTTPGARKRTSRAARLGLALLLCALATSCANIGYYLQSVRGQLDIWARQEDIETVLAKTGTPQPLREKLQADIRARGQPTNPAELEGWYKPVPAAENASLKILQAGDLCVEPAQGSDPGEVEWRDIPHTDDLARQTRAAHSRRRRPAVES